MKAIVSKFAGGPATLTLENLPTPNVGPGEVLLSVRACGVNYPDVLIIQDLYQIKPARPFIPGTEVSGVVEELGAGVDNLRIGDRVIGFSTHGGMAERMALPAKNCTLIPDTMPFDEAAVFMNTYGTAYYALKNRACLTAGETLLVLGAAGGTGTAAIELGKALGARVVGAVSSADKASFVMSRGADECMTYPRGPFDDEGKKGLAQLFKQACSPEGANVIYDPIGGDYTEAALRCISWGGRFLVIGFTAGIAKVPMNLPLLKSCQITGVFYGAFIDRQPEDNKSNAQELLGLYAAGSIKPAISARVPLENCRSALEMLASRDIMGKVVISLE